jgi:acylphosphatase
MARKLGLLGWVKNEGDGSVSIVAQGEKEKLDELVSWCQEGPEGAKVDNVEMKEVITEEELPEFCVQY